MSEKERLEEDKFWEKFEKKVTKTPQASMDFLIELGVLTKKGNVSKSYRHLCTPAEQV